MLSKRNDKAVATFSDFIAKAEIMCGPIGIRKVMDVINRVHTNIVEVIVQHAFSSWSNNVTQMDACVLR